MFPFNILNLLQTCFQTIHFLLPFSKPCFNLVQHFFLIFFILVPKWSAFIFQVFYVHYHEVATCSFLTKESAWFKKLTLALNVVFLSFDETLFATVKVYDMLILNLKTTNTLNLFPDQFIIKILIPSTHNGLVYL